MQGAINNTALEKERLIATAQTLAHVLHMQGTAAKSNAPQIRPKHGKHQLRRKGTGEEFWQYRPYEQGDSAHLIDWRQSGKTDHLYLRQKQRENTRNIGIWVDSNNTMDFSSSPKSLDTKYNYALVLALTLGFYHIENGDSVICADQKIPPKNPQNRLYDNLKEPQDIHHVKTRHLDTLYIFTDTLDNPQNWPQIVEDLGSGHACDIFLIHIFDPAELDFPYNGSTVFQDVTGNTALSTPQASAVRDEYLRRIDAHKDNIQNAARKSAVHYGQSRTDDTQEDVLSHILGGAL